MRWTVHFELQLQQVITVFFLKSHLWKMESLKQVFSYCYVVVSVFRVIRQGTSGDWFLLELFSATVYLKMIARTRTI